jgi:SAM-dependent methyltransferase
MPAVVDQNKNLETIDCPVCKTCHQSQFLNLRERLKGEEEFTIARCNDCGLLMTNPRPTPAALSSYYPATYYSYAPVKVKQRSRFRQYAFELNRWYKNTLLQIYFGYHHLGSRAEQEKTVLGRLIFSVKAVLVLPLFLRAKWTGKDLKALPFRSPGRLLDVGCGSGRELLTHQSLGWKVTGVETSEQGCRVAQQHGLDVRCGDLTQINFAPDSFDLIYLSHCFEHLSAPCETLDKIRDILSPEGLMIMKIPNAGSWEAGWFGKRWFLYDAPRHLFHYTPHTIRDMISRRGLRVTKIQFDPGAAYGFRKSLTQLWQEKYAKTLKHGFWLEFVSQCITTLACWMGRGPVMAVYVEKNRDVA